MSDANYDLVPTSLAVKAMRDSGYKNTAYAVAELIDNSIQAGARAIELLCCERESQVQLRVRRNIHQVAVLDDGRGMDAAVLRMALQFGNGQYLDDRSGIGRFGMGLPSSSISQCRRVEVWSWQKGHENAIYSSIDLDLVEEGVQTTVPEPEQKAIPDVWLTAGETFGKSGTLVVWSRLDRCLWKTALSIIKNSELVIGRMYRRFIHTGEVAIRMASFEENAPSKFFEQRLAEVNDPIYLMAPSSTPQPYDQKAMFRTDGDRWEVTDTISFRGNEYPVVTRFTIAKEEARNRPNAGATPYGKHAKNNVGVSLVRAERELELETSLVNQYDPRERWWGVEVDFPPGLDEIFGVTNNKQAARNFTEAARALEGVLSDAESIAELKDEMFEEQDPRGPLLEIVHLVDRRLRDIRKLIQIQTKGSRRRRRHEVDSAEARATDITRTRQEEGYRGASDDDEGLPQEERKAALAKEFEETGLSAEQAQELAAQTIEQDIKYTFTNADLEGRTFFTVRPVAGEIVIKLNINHPAYEHLVEVLEDDADEQISPELVRDRLNRANRGLKLLLMAWARFEDEAYPEKKKADVQDLRTEWGRYAAQFLEDER